MNYILKVFLSISVLISLNMCSSIDDDDDCMKTITIPQYYNVNNQIYSYDTTLEVPCDFSEPSEPELIDPPELENFSYEVLSFNFYPDTGNNTSRLQFEIKYNNPNNFTTSGFPLITLNVDGTITSSSYSTYATNTCFQINSNSSCTSFYNIESSLDVGIINAIELVNVKYYKTN